jgi:putative PEP-CTERM system TPR-repeat lipoprotein
MKNYSPLPLPSLILAALLSLTACGQNLTATEHVSKAKDYIDKGQLKPALIELSSAVQKDPNSVEGRWLLAKVTADMGEGARAEKEIRKAMELGLNRASGQVTLVRSLLLQDDLDRVLQESSVIPPGTPPADQATILGLRGQAYIAKGQFDLAQQALEHALQVKPDSVPALIGMTALNGYQRHYDVARQWVGKALKADPASPEAWSALGDLEMAQGHLAEAEKAYDNAISHRATPYLERVKRAQVRIQLKKYPEAAADIKALRDAGLKDHPLVNYVAGLNAFAQKNYQDAAAAFQASYTANPDFLPNRIYLATTQLLLGNTEQALSHAQQIAAAVPRSKTAQGLLSSVLISRGEYEAATGVLQNILAKSPNDPQALGMMATVALREGNTTKGLEYAKKLAASQPDSKQAQELLALAKLMAGEALDNSIHQAGTQAAAAGDVYTREFMAALAAFRDGKLKQALDSARRLQARYPDKVDPPKLAAAVYLAAAQWDLGKAELEKAIRIDPNDASATRNLGRIELIQGNYQKAKERILPLVKRQPGDIEAVRILAAAETRLGSPSGAIEALEQALKDKPDDLSLLTELAQIRLRGGSPGKVVEMTRSLTDAQYQQQPALLELRGKAQLLSGDTAGAAGSFEKLVRLVPNAAPAHFQYANALASRGDAARARKELEQAIKLDPRYLPARVGEIRMRVQSNELDQARKALTKLRQDFGDRVEVLGIEGWFALGTRDFPTAEQKLTAALKKAPSSELLLLATRAQWAQKKQEPALTAMREWLKSHPGDMAVHMQLAGAYLDMGREADAAAKYEQVVKLAPRHVPALNNLAWLNRDRDLKKAMDYAQQAYQLAPKDPFVLDTLGMLTLKNGDASRAVSLLQDAATRSPNDAQIQVHLASALIQQGRTGEAQKLLGTVASKAANTRAGQEAKKLLDTLGKR